MNKVSFKTKWNVTRFKESGSWEENESVKI